MALYRLDEPSDQLNAPVLIAAFDGWIDAAGAASTAAEHVADGGARIAAFDGDVLFDYRSRRPTLDVVDGTLRDLMWPALSLQRTTVEGRDLLVLHGAEPDFRWQELGQDVLALCLRLGVVQWISLGAIPAAVPHTRPVPVLATASAPDLLHHDVAVGPAGLLRVPSAALSAIELAVTGSGMPAVGFYGQVPHYVGGPYAAATIALLEHLSRHVGVTVALGDLPDQALNQRQRLDAAAAADDDTRDYIQRLEQIAGEEGVPSGDDLAQEIERFLRDQGGERRDERG